MRNRQKMARLLVAGSLLMVASGTGCSSSKKKLGFTSTPPTSVTAGQTYSFQAAVTGGSGPVSYQLITAPAGMTVSTGGLVSWQTSAGDVGSHGIALNATSGGKSGRLNWTIQVVAAAPLQASPLDRALHLHWRDSLERAGDVPERALLATLDGLAVYGFGWTDENGTPDLASSSQPELNSWRNAETRAEFLAMIEKFVALARPASLYLGNEVDPDPAGFDAAERSVWLEVLADARARVAAASPETTVLDGP